MSLDELLRYWELRGYRVCGSDGDEALLMRRGEDPVRPTPQEIVAEMERYVDAAMILRQPFNHYAVGYNQALDMFRDHMKTWLLSSKLTNSSPNPLNPKK